MSGGYHPSRLQVCDLHHTQATPSSERTKSADESQVAQAASPALFLYAIYRMWITRPFPVAKIFVSIISPEEGIESVW
jgi:hypothetical protein